MVVDYYRHILRAQLGNRIVPIGATGYFLNNKYNYIHENQKNRNYRYRISVYHSVSFLERTGREA